MGARGPGLGQRALRCSGTANLPPLLAALVKALNVSTCGLSSSAAIGVVGARRRPLVARATADGVDMSWRNKPANEIRVLVVGSTGYIGRTVVKARAAARCSRHAEDGSRKQETLPTLARRCPAASSQELVSHGFEVTAVARSKSGVGAKNSEGDVLRDLRGAKVLFGNVADEDELDFALQNKQFDVVVSCLASRTGDWRCGSGCSLCMRVHACVFSGPDHASSRSAGGIKDSWLIDYRATRNAMMVGQAHGAKHFVLLSAICVQKPLLEFQKAKLKFESDLVANKGMTHSIVRPTAFFKVQLAAILLCAGSRPGQRAMPRQARPRWPLPRSRSRARSRASRAVLRTSCSGTATSRRASPSRRRTSRPSLPTASSTGTTTSPTRSSPSAALAPRSPPASRQTCCSKSPA